MKLTKLCLYVIGIVVSVSTSALPTIARADTYSVNLIALDNELRVYGIEGSGVVVFTALIIDNCGPNGSVGTCYTTSGLSQ